MAGLIAALAAAPARLGGGGALDISLARIISALLLCLVLAAAAAYLLKRGGGRVDWAAFKDWRSTRPTRRIDVIESRRITQHADLCLVRCDGEDILILSSQTSQQVLRRIPIGGKAP